MFFFAVLMIWWGQIREFSGKSVKSSIFYAVRSWREHEKWWKGSFTFWEKLIESTNKLNTLLRLFFSTSTWLFKSPTIVNIPELRKAGSAVECKAVQEAMEKLKMFDFFVKLGDRPVEMQVSFGTLAQLNFLEYSVMVSGGFSKVLFIQDAEFVGRWISWKRWIEVTHCSFVLLSRLHLFCRLQNHFNNNQTVKTATD